MPTARDEKSCPSCGTVNQAEATICNFCGVEFTEDIAVTDNLDGASLLKRMYEINSGKSEAAAKAAAAAPPAPPAPPAPLP